MNKVISWHVSKDEMIRTGQDQYIETDFANPNRELVKCNKCGQSAIEVRVVKQTENITESRLYCTVCDEFTSATIRDGETLFDTGARE